MQIIYHLFGGRIDLSATSEQILNYVDVALLARQVQGIQPVLQQFSTFNRRLFSARSGPVGFGPFQLNLDPKMDPELF